jgi:single-strand DNA-binding protein
MANSFELIGSLKVIEDLQTFKSGFTKREFVIEVPDGKYPQMIKFECVRDKIELLNSLNVGDEVKVTFDIRGNEYNGRYYVNLNAWKIESIHSQGGGQGAGDPPASSFDSAFDSEPDPSDDDIPF